MKKDTGLSRPSMNQYNSANDFLSAVYIYHKKKGDFSLRKRCMELGSFSQAFVSQILNRQRNITPKNLPFLSTLFFLTPEETAHMAEQIRLNPSMRKSIHAPDKPQLKHWFDPYVLALADFADFVPTPAYLSAKLGGLVEENRIEKSIRVLFSEGFWRKSLTAGVLRDSSVGLPEQSMSPVLLEKYHQKALDIVKARMEKSPEDLRQAKTLILALDEARYQRLLEITAQFERDLKDLYQQTSTSADRLIQITFHAIPINDNRNSQ